MFHDDSGARRDTERDATLQGGSYRGAITRVVIEFLGVSVVSINLKFIALCSLDGGELQKHQQKRLKKRLLKKTRLLKRLSKNKKLNRRIQSFFQMDQSGKTRF